MKKKITVTKLLIAIFLTFSAAQFLQAQITTASISGRVVGNGETLPGATIKVVHTPTGTVHGVTTNASGTFNLPNLRPGGPYTVSVSFIGFRTQEFTDITLALGSNLPLDVELMTEALALEQVIISAEAINSNMSPSNAGANTNISSTQIATLPTASRTITDLIRMTPQANGGSIGGGNQRQNFVTVDGAAFNNAFGIGGMLPGGGIPISIDALEQITVNITPFDVRQSGFIGSSVNAVTRSGTNEFRGTAYTFMHNERWRGRTVDGVEIPRPESQHNLYGVSIGGPIIRDRLFFFLNAELENNVSPGLARVASTDGVANAAAGIARPTYEEMTTIRNFLRDNFGYETGPFQGFSNESPRRRFLARVDWNINNNHRLNVRYSYMRSSVPENASSSSNFGAAGHRFAQTENRTAIGSLLFQNTNYFQEYNFSSLSSELNSSFLDGRLNNILRFTWSHQYEPRSIGGGNSDFPFVDILRDGSVFTSFGTEMFSFGTMRDVNTITISNEITYTTGIHTLTGGFSYEWNRIKNSFMPAGAGWYVFDSWEDFAEGRNPSLFGQTISNLPNFEQPFPGFQFHQYTLFLQNEMRISPRFNLTAGLRLDLPIFPENPNIQTHPLLAELDFNGTFYDTGVLPRSRVMFSPRIGFNYDLTGDRSIVARGGTGIFTGRIPFVWIVAQSGEAGMLQSRIVFDGVDNTPGPFNPDVRHWFPDTPPTPGTLIPTTPVIMDSDFRMPSAWKTSMALDFRLPFGLNASIEGIFNRDLNAVGFYRDGMIAPQAMAGVDNRLVYLGGAQRFIHRQDLASLELRPDGGSGVQPLVITNVPNNENGHYFSLTGTLEKRFWRGLSGMVSYTRSWARSLHDGIGDQVASAWSSINTVNGGNSRELGFANYVMPNRLIGGLSYRFEYARHFSTTVSLFYGGGNSGRGSFVHTVNIVGDGAAANLIYVPRDPSEITFAYRTVGTGANAVVWTPQEQSDAFFRLVEQDRHLSNRRGQHAERGGVVLPWVHQFDIRIMQNFYLNAGGRRHTLQVGLDIMNVGNLLHSSWGNRWQMTQNAILTPGWINDAGNFVPVTFAGGSGALGNGDVEPVFQLNPITGTTEKPTEIFRRVASQASTYWIQLGIRYIF